MQWMVWTPVTAWFFVFIGVMLCCMTVWEVVSPTVARKGFLPIVTTRGDRLFIGLLGSGYICLAWLGLTDLPLWYGVGIAAAWLVTVMRWG
ncbi:DUF2160 domain-containing protein [Desulfovibrio oxyclinae]|jgi:predicted small integral membrane protein|uniref:DUF2160 domain-containing protein n=1 Tax=Desulfovibrio oxyclinae TaxID=63560 RepID=UPI000376CA5C|nr:DUF2160 domain-containing protein [Desulfovibrio oxyclinae]